jgi:chromosome segregation ATPase
MDIEKIKQVVDGVIEEKLSVVQTETSEENLDGLLTEASSKIEELNNVLISKVEEVASLVEQLENSSADLEKKNEKIVELENQISNLNGAMEVKDSELKSATATLNSLSDELLVLKETLDKLNKEKVLEIRLKELADLNILRQGDKLLSQKEKVSGLSDEDFEVYKDDLVSLRKEFSVGVTADNQLNSSVASLNIEGGIENSSSEYEKLGKVMAEKAKSRLRR